MGRLCFLQIGLFACVLLFNSAVADWEEYTEFMQLLQDREDSVALWREELMLTRSENVSSKPSVIDFECDTTPSPTAPETVHELRAGDIRVIGAMGDSLTAANGADANGPIRVMYEYRGFSWSVGGYRSLERGVTTLPNILKNFNSKLVGYSTKTGNVDSSGAGLNVAVPGNIAEHMPGQARLLVSRMKARVDVNMNSDWKMITLLIGGNDLCHSCKDTDRYSPENYVSHIRTALDILHQELPRTFVNLVPLFDVTPVAQMGKGPICKGVHRVLCDCAKKLPEDNNERAAAYRRGLEDLVNSGRYETRDDFTVVFQPFMAHADVPRHDDGNPDLSFFAPDCFHFSAKGHAAAATMLFNGMFEPVNNKDRDIGFHTKLQCPNKDDFLATAKNIPRGAK